MESTGVSVRATEDFQSAIAEVDAQNENSLRLKRALRSNDGFYSTFVLRRLSSFVTRIAIRKGWTPNSITLVSLYISLITALLFATGNRLALVVGAFLVQLSIIVDCSDGEVARYTGVSSKLGAWLDASTDRVKEYAIYAGLAYGASRNGQSLWGWAIALVVLQTVRHLSDYNFVAIRTVRESVAIRLPLNQTNDLGVQGAGALLDKSAALNSRKWIYWIKRVIYMPIGERWLVISIGALLASPAFVFYVLFGLGMFGLIYVSYGRFVRSSTWTHTQENSGCEIVERQLDFGPMLKWFFADASHPLRGRFGWAAPAIIRFIELTCIGLVAKGEPWAYLFLFAVAFHHYDTLYRSLGGSVFPKNLTSLGLGFDGRILLTLAIGFGFILSAKIWFILLGLYFAVVLVVIPSRQWIVELKAN
jgi:phosphatidylglycerophosphate synthase